MNLYTELDAIPIPRIEDRINDLAKRRYFLKYDFKNKYHQVLIHPNDRKLILFEANGRFLQFKRVPFGSPNVVVVFYCDVTLIFNEEN